MTRRKRLALTCTLAGTLAACGGSLINYSYVSDNYQPYELSYAAGKGGMLTENFKGRGKVDVGRFKGLGEMSAKQLKDTTMDPKSRILLRVAIADHEDPDPRAEQKRSAKTVERLMGRRPELRFRFIQENARFVEADHLDV